LIVPVAYSLFEDLRVWLARRKGSAPEALEPEASAAEE
jgi:hypothetical protein